MTSSIATRLALAGLSVRGVLDEGIPRHPSGGVYLRAPIATYAAAASAAVFGPSEWSIRFPSVLFSLATFALDRDVGGRTAGLVAAAIVARDGITRVLRIPPRTPAP